MLILSLTCTGILIFSWSAVDSIGGLWTFAVIYGILANSSQGMFPAALASAGRDPARLGAEMGMVFSLISIGCLCGTPIAGALIQLDHGAYFLAQMFAGAAMVAGALLLLGPRVIAVGWGPRRKV